jgi:hypothetical protein
MAEQEVSRADMNKSKLLAKFLRAFSDGAKPFDWERNNCGTLGGAWWLQATGRDVMAHMPPTRCERAARRLVRSFGGLVGAVETATGVKPSPPMLAQLGDLVVAKIGDSPEVRGDQGPRLAVGICGGGHIILIDASGRLQPFPLSRAVAAFRLPEVAA